MVHPAWCSSLTAGLPADISKLVNLQVLDLSRHQGSEYAALAVDQSSLNLAAIWQQTQLTRLDMPVSETIRWLPRQIGLLQHLHTLRLDGCTALSKLEAGGISSSETCSLSVGFEGLTRLQVLSLAGCSSLQELPAAVWKLPELLELDLSNCSSLTALVPAAGIGSSSGSGDGGGSSISISISISISSSSSLTELKLQQCTNLASLQAHLTKLSRLQALELKGCDALTKLPNLKGMSALTSLVMQGCVLEELPHSLSTLSQLNVLDLLECSKLKSLPNTIWNLPALQVLHVKHCSTLTTLPDAEVRALLPPVEELVLTGCSLALLPELVGRLSSLTRLDLSQCSKLEALPNRMNGMFNLHTLNLASCSKLAKLPDKLPASLRMLDLSYCCQQASLGQSLLNVAHQIGEAEVPLARWENLIAVHLDHNEATDRNLNLNLNLSDPGSASACLRALRRATVIEALLADESFVRDLLTKLSWLAILLASAAIAAGRAPPGGWNQGGLPSCNSTMGHSTCPAGSQGYLRQFFVLDLLTFGFSAALVLLLVASAIPCRNVGDRAAVAGQMFLVLCLAVLLLSAALGCGMWTLWVGVLAVYPSEYAGQDVWGPLKVSLALMGLAWIVLIIRPLLLFPGWQAVYKAVTMDPVMGVPINIVQCVAAGLWRLVPGWLKQHVHHVGQWLMQKRRTTATAMLRSISCSTTA